MLTYNVTLALVADLSGQRDPFRTTVEIEDQADPVQNNGAAIRAAILKASAAGLVASEPLRVERVP
jgi:hypothetical protein